MKRVKKFSTVDDRRIENVMWGLFALETIPAGAFVVEYTGEVLTTKEADRRGRNYDMYGMSYLFDMNDADDSDDYEKNIQDCS